MLSFLMVLAVSSAALPPIDPVKDHIPVCITNLLDTIRLENSSQKSVVLDNYLAATKLTKKEKEQFRKECEFFNNGVGFGIAVMKDRYEKSAKPVFETR